MTPVNLGIAHKLKNNERYRKAFFREDAIESIALQISHLRKELGLSQAELATAAGTQQPAISRIENATDASCNLARLFRIAEGLDACIVVTFKPINEAIASFVGRDAVDAQCSDAKPEIRKGVK